MTTKESTISLLSATQKNGLTANHLLVLLTLDVPIPITQLAAICHISTAACTGMIDRMEKLNLVRRRHCHMDRRIIKVEITPNGQRTLDRIITE